MSGLCRKCSLLVPQAAQAEVCTGRALPLLVVAGAAAVTTGAGWLWVGAGVDVVVDTLAVFV